MTGRNCPWCGSEWWNGERCADCGADEGRISRGQIRYTPERTRKTPAAKAGESTPADTSTVSLSESPARTTSGDPK